MPIDKNTITEILKTSFQDADISLKDLMGDQNHYELHIASSAFSGLSVLNQHKLVHKALKNYLGDALHALTIKTIPKHTDS
ncbi:MAG: BolA/IbaG family iron-sulfur metabolism protein [Proteobacteria bacterium]|nr:BolA/IbaG family iron-sulfur metabolism protein [Pseudomonadota bacterium]